MVSGSSGLWSVIFQVSGRWCQVGATAVGGRWFCTTPDEDIAFSPLDTCTEIESHQSIKLTSDVRGISLTLLT